MELFDKLKGFIRNLSLFEFALIKIALVTVGVLAAKLFPLLTSLEWQWYCWIYLVVMAWPIYKLVQIKKVRS